MYYTMTVQRCWGNFSPLSRQACNTGHSGKASRLSIVTCLTFALQGLLSVFLPVFFFEFCSHYFLFWGVSCTLVGGNFYRLPALNENPAHVIKLFLQSDFFIFNNVIPYVFEIKLKDSYIFFTFNYFSFYIMQFPIGMPQGCNAWLKQQTSSQYEYSCCHVKGSTIIA